MYDYAFFTAGAVYVGFGRIPGIGRLREPPFCRLLQRSMCPDHRLPKIGRTSEWSMQMVEEQCRTVVVVRTTWYVCASVAILSHG